MSHCAAALFSGLPWTHRGGGVVGNSQWVENGLSSVGLQHGNRCTSIKELLLIVVACAVWG